MANLGYQSTINYIEDTRYSEDSISTHDKITIPCSRAQKLSQVDIPKFKKIDLKDRFKQFYEKIIINLFEINRSILL